MSDPLTLLSIVGLLESLDEEDKKRGQKHVVFYKKTTTGGSFRPSKRGVKFPFYGRGRLNRMIIRADGDYTIHLSHDNSTIIRTFSQLLEEREEWTNISAYYKDGQRVVVISDIDFYKFIDVVIYPKSKSTFNITTDILIEG